MRNTPQALTTPPERPARRRLLRGLAGAWIGGAGLGLSGCGGGDAADAADGSASAQAGDAPGRKRGLGGVDSGGTGHPAYFAAMLDAVQADAAMASAAGVTLDLAAARIVDAQGQVVAHGALAPGMGCRIETEPLKSVDGRVIAVVRDMRVAEQLVGRLDAVDAGEVSGLVLGHRLQVGTSTRFGAGLPGGLAGCAPGTSLRVWGEDGGLPGQIVATRVELAAPADPRVLRGLLTRLDRSLGLAAIGPHVFALPAGVEGGVVDEGLAVGQWVRARWAADALGAAGRLLRLSADGLRLPPGHEVELHGRISRIDSPRRWAVDGVEVELAAGATVQGQRWLALGARAELHGQADGRGVLVADEVALEAPEPVELAGSITQVDATKRWFVVQGRTVRWNDATVFEGGRSRLLLPRRRVAVVGQWTADRSAVIATRVHIEA